jgi:hypothetical protein
MKTTRILLIGLATLVVALTGCASTELANYRFAGARMVVDARVSPDAEVYAFYSVTIDPDDPVRTAISIGSSLAKANQVRIAEEKLYGAMQETDIRMIVEDEVGDYVETSLGVEVIEDRRRADFQLLIEVEEYGIDAGGSSGGVEFELTAIATLFDLRDGGRIWRTRESVSREASPSMFGIPSAAGNVLSAVALAELSEEEIARGLDRLARDAAWEIGEELEKDIYRARRRR